MFLQIKMEIILLAQKWSVSGISGNNCYIKCSLRFYRAVRKVHLKRKYNVLQTWKLSKNTNCDYAFVYIKHYITDTNWLIMLITHTICWVKFIRQRFPLNNFIIHKIDLALFTQSYNKLVIDLPELDLQTSAYLKWSFLQHHVTDEDHKLLLQRASA